PELGALGIRHPRVGRHRGGLGATSDVDLGLRREIVTAQVRQVQIGDRPRELRSIGKSSVRILGGDLGEPGRFFDHALERAGREGRGRGRGGGAAGEDAQRESLIVRVRHRVDLAQSYGGAEVALVDEEAVGSGGAEHGRALEDRDEQVGVDPAHTCVPPTVIPSMRMVGRPTPTGTDWPSLPHVPIPACSFRSWPTRVTRVSASGPLPMSVAPLTGAVTRPSSIRYASLAEKTNLPLVMSTWPPPNATA